VSPALTTFLFEAANFLILTAALGWLFFKPVRATIEARRRHLAEEMEQASRSHEEALALHAEITRERQALKEELERERAQARTEAQAAASTIIAAAREQAQREREAARQSAASLQQADIQRLGSAAAAAAREVVIQLLVRIGSVPLAEALVQAACQELSRLNSGELSPVTVESAQDLGLEERAKLSAALGPDITPSFRVVPDLVAGVRVITRRGMVDASIAGLSSYAEHVLSSAVREAIDE
jgi:F-type H+-transporting ATPase subunit b